MISIALTTTETAKQFRAMPDIVEIRSVVLTPFAERHVSDFESILSL